MMKETRILDSEKLKEIYTNEKFRNEVAFAHGRHDRNGKFIEKITCSYPVTWIVTDEQIAEAETERLRAKAEKIANIGNKLVFVGMGMTYDLSDTDDIGNFRIRTEFINRVGNRFFVEFMHSGRQGTNTKGEKYIYCDFAIDRTKQDLLNDSHARQGEFYNYKGLEKKGSNFTYTKKGILGFINCHFDCNFSELEIDNYNLRTDDFVCVSPK